MFRLSRNREISLTNLAIVRDASSSQALLAVIIVNFRTPDLTIDCLQSVAAEVSNLQFIQVFIVENGSGDDSAQRINDRIESAHWHSWCNFVLSDRNLGFSGGNNLGIAAANRAGGAKYFLLLNSDTIVQRGCFARCMQILDADPGIGALSCRLINADGSIQNVCRKFPTPLRCFLAQLLLPWWLPAWFSWADCEDPGWDRNTVARDVEWIGGAFMMLRGDWIARHKALDDRFFFYGEDIELCHRVWRTGFRCHYDPGSTVIHLGGASSDPSRMPGGTRSFHYWRGRYLIQEICYGRIARLFLQGSDILSTACRIGWWRIAGRSKSQDYHERKADLHFLARNWTLWNRHES